MRVYALIGHVRGVTGRRERPSMERMAVTAVGSIGHRPAIGTGPHRLGRIRTATAHARGPS